MTIGPVRLIYLALLETVSTAAVREFWQGHPLEEDGRPMREVELYRALWNHTGHVSAYYVESAWNAFEVFVHRHGGSGPRGSLTEKIHGLHLSGMWRADQVLAWNKAVLPRLYRDPNPMLVLVHIVGETGSHAFPGSWAGVVKHRRLGEWDEAVSAWAPSEALAFQFLYPVEFHATPFHRAVSSYFGMPAFDEVRLIADCRPPSMVLWNESTETRGEEFFVGDRSVGRVVSFAAWAAAAGLDFGGFSVPDRPVVLVDVDHVCPERGRAVLLGGAVYGAPVYLARFRFRPESSSRAVERAENYLNTIIAEMQKADDQSSPIAVAHRRVVESAEEKLVFEFVRAADVLRLNGRTFLTGVPARILHKVLVGFAEGRTSFDYRTFKLDPELFRDPKNTGFEVRLKRIQEKLEREVPSLRLERIREGEFAVTPSCPVHLVEPTG